MHREHPLPRPPRNPREAGHRAAQLGVRQLRHPVQGVRHPRHPARPVREDRRCGAGPTSTPLSPPSVALHIPWDLVDSYDDLRKHAEDLGVTLGTINSNTFQDDDYKFGALTHEDAGVRQKAIDHHLACIDVMDATGSRDLKIWLAEGSNYPGQADLRGRQDRLQESLQKIYARLGDDQRLVLEYKFFEPAFYHTDVPDWGTSYAQVSALGEKAWSASTPVTHAPGTNIEFIVMQLLRLGKLGSFDFNSRFYADDDLIVGAADPFQLFRILFEVIRGGGLNNPDVAIHARPVPQRRGQDPRPDPLRAQRAGDDRPRAARRPRCAHRRAEVGDVLAANAVFMDAFYTDVRPALAEWRESRGLAADPMAAYAASGYQQKIAADRVGGVQAGWGA